MVNRIAPDKQARILNMLVEGSSMRSISRIEGCGINTIGRLVVEAGKACMAYHDQHVRDVPAQVIQCDEIWSFLYAKRKNVDYAKAPPEGAGDLWTWTAIDSDTKLMISWLVSVSRDGQSAIELMDDLRERTANRFQLTTDEPERLPRSRKGRVRRRRGLCPAHQTVRGCSQRRSTAVLAIGMRREPPGNHRW